MIKNHDRSLNARIASEARPVDYYPERGGFALHRLGKKSISIEI